MILRWGAPWGTRLAVPLCRPCRFLPPIGVFLYVHEETLGDHENSVTTMVILPDGMSLASGSEDGLPLLHSTIDWKPSRRFVDASLLISLTWDPLSLVGTPSVGSRVAACIQYNAIHPRQKSVTHRRWWGRLRRFSQIATELLRLKGQFDS